MKSYTVKSGDTLSKIATAHNTSVDNIMKVNPSITNANLIYVNQKINIPDNTSKTEAPVKTGTSTDYSKIGKKVSEVLDDIRCLKSFRELEKLLG